MNETLTLEHDMTRRWYNQPLLVDVETALYLKRLAESGHRLTKPKPSADMLVMAAMDPELFNGEPQRRPYMLQDGVAQIQVRGFLENNSYWYSMYWTGYDAIRVRMQTAMADPDVKGIALMIDSNGGEVAGNFDLVDEIYEMRQDKPIIAVSNENAYSAAYSIASAADKLYVNRTGGVGSIGVVMAHYDLSQMLEQEGINVTLIYAGARKVDGNRFQPLSKEALNAAQEQIDALYDIFVETVARNRGMDPADVRATEAGLFRGEGAVDAGLVDEVMSANDALAQFTSELEGSQSTGAYFMSDKQTPAPGAETGDTVSKSDHEAALTAARTEARAEGVQAENERIMGILGCEEAEGREQAAQTLASKPEMTVDTAKEILAGLPEGKPVSRDLLTEAMEGTGGGAGVPTGGEATGQPAPLLKVPNTTAIYDQRNKPAA